MFLNFHRFSDVELSAEAGTGGKRDSYMRAGWMAAFESFDDFKQYSGEILRLIEDELSCPASISTKVLDALDAADSLSDGNRLSTSINVSMSDPVARAPAVGENRTFTLIHKIECI